jgi:hypothetical protein
MEESELESICSRLAERLAGEAARRLSPKLISRKKRQGEDVR